MKNFMKTVAVLAVLLTTGCASMFQGTTEEVTVKTKKDNDQRMTECTLYNDNGSWESDARDTVTIHRSNNPLTIECENDLQEGTATVQSTASGGYLFLGFLLDFCIFTCTIDIVSDAAFDYPAHVSVYMRDKEQKSTATKKTESPDAG